MDSERADSPLQHSEAPQVIAHGRTISTDSTGHFSDVAPRLEKQPFEEIEKFPIAKRARVRGREGRWP